MSEIKLNPFWVLGLTRCACVFDRKSEFDEPDVVERCGHHRSQDEEISNIRDELSAVTQERDRLRKAINEISQTPHNPDAFLVAGNAIYDIEIAPCTEVRERAKETT